MDLMLPNCLLLVFFFWKLCRLLPIDYYWTHNCSQDLIVSSFIFLFNKDSLSEAFTKVFEA